MSTYLLVNVLSIAIPLIASFDPRLKFYKHWKSIIAAIFLSMIPYVLWDIYFVNNGYWGFNSSHIGEFNLFGLPIEEVLFFVTIPYACMFTHYTLVKLYPNVKLSRATTNYITLGLLLFFGIVLLMHSDKAYTAWDMIYALVILIATRVLNRKLLGTYYITFMVMLLPFFLVNGVLTGTGIQEAVVWYNDDENLGMRILSIPVEDIAYAFSLILLNLLLFARFSRVKLGNVQ